MDAYRLTGLRKYFVKAEELIQRCVHPKDDITGRGLDDPEHRWSYLVFLQVLGKYLDFKVELGERDYYFHYAGESLLHYADWIMENEVPYKDVLHKVEIPTETWPAHDIRKCCVLLFAAKYGPPADRRKYSDQARFFFNRCIQDLLTFETAFLVRPLVILTGCGFVRAYFENRVCDDDFSVHAYNFGLPEEFLTQKARFRISLKSKLDIIHGTLNRFISSNFARSGTGSRPSPCLDGEILIQMPKPKLLYIVHSLNPGGAERLAVEMSRSFAGQFHVSVVCLDEPGLWAADLRRQGIPFTAYTVNPVWI